MEQIKLPKTQEELVKEREAYFKKIVEEYVTDLRKVTSPTPIYEPKPREGGPGI